MSEVSRFDLVVETVYKSLELLVNVIIVRDIIRLTRDYVDTTIIVLSLSISHVDRHG